MREQLGDQPPERHSRWEEVKRKLEDAKDSRFKNVDSGLREDYYRYLNTFLFSYSIFSNDSSLHQYLSDEYGDHDK